MRKMLWLLAALATPVGAQTAPPLFEASATVPLTPGQWLYAATPSGSEARFGAHFLIRCDSVARRVTLRRTESFVAAPVTALTITTDLASRIMPPGGVLATVDPTLDAIAFSRGRFIVTGGGDGSRLVVPASAEAARSIEDCRN